jgi:hypothetical protein
VAFRFSNRRVRWPVRVDDSGSHFPTKTFAHRRHGFEAEYRTDGRTFPLPARVWIGIDWRGRQPPVTREDLPMSMSLRLLAISAAFAVAGAAFAATPQAGTAAAPAKAKTAQQQRMVDCNKQATGKKGDERKAFMSSCLKGESMTAAPAAKQTQQEKMKTCNTDAKTKALKGADRKTFMSSCLKGDSAAPASP